MKWQDSTKVIITQKLHRIRNWEFQNMLNGMCTIEMNWKPPKSKIRPKCGCVPFQSVWATIWLTNLQFKVIVMRNDRLISGKLWKCWIHCYNATFDWQIYNFLLKASIRTFSAQQRNKKKKKKGIFLFLVYKLEGF